MKLSFRVILQRVGFIYALSYFSITSCYAKELIDKQLQSSTLSSSPSTLLRAIESGPVVSLVLMTLILMSITTWAILAAKWIYLRKIEKNCEQFEKFFWKSRSMNELSNSLENYPPSPLKELFKNTYSELLKGRKFNSEEVPTEIAIGATVDNLSRTLLKSKLTEKKYLERYLNILAISASACPFIGLFGTVWGIMTAFEGIARTGSSSLAAVAPGISEALIATAFGLAAAIPAAIGYNVSTSKIRNVLSNMDGFGYDILNIIERYLITEKGKQQIIPDEQIPRI